MRSVPGVTPITIWTQWLDRATDHASDREIGRRTGLNHTTISRWRNAGRASAEGTIAIARAYRADPVDGLIAAGILTEAEVLARDVRAVVRRAPTVFLTEELHGRATSGRLSVPQAGRPAPRADHRKIRDRGSRDGS